MVEQQQKDVFIGSQAPHVYTFYTIISRMQEVQLMEQGRIRLGRYTALRMDEPAFQWDGMGEAIKREEHVSGTLQAHWFAAEVVALAAVSSGGTPFPSCQLLQRRLVCPKAA